MIEFEKLEINSKELYKQFKNAFDKGHTHLKIERDDKDTLYFKILKDGDDISVQCDDSTTFNYFRECWNFQCLGYVLKFRKSIFIPLPYVKGRKISKKQKIEQEIDNRFYDELNDDTNKVEFMTKEEYKIEKMENKIERLERLVTEMTELSVRIHRAEEDIKELDRKKRNKFFIK